MEQGRHLGDQLAGESLGTWINDSRRFIFCQCRNAKGIFFDLTKKKQHAASNTYSNVFCVTAGCKVTTGGQTSMSLPEHRGDGQPHKVDPQQFLAADFLSGMKEIFATERIPLFILTL